MRCAPEDAITVADSLADAICEPGRWHWRRLRLEGILAGEPSTMAWLKAMADRGNLIRFRSKMNVWFKPAANTWEDFLATHSKRTRSKLRQLLRLVDNDVALEPVLLTQPADVIKQLPSFIDLHQRRWNAVGQPGSFASSAMRDFINTLTTQLAPSGQIRIAGLQHGQQLIAGELHLIGLDSRRYVYSMGVDPAFRGQSPGTILNAITMRECIASGCAGVDFLRGDEEYKSRLRAAPVPLLEIDVFAATPAGRRAAMYDAAWMKARQIWRRRRGEPAIDEWSFQNGIVGDELPSTTGAVLRWNDYGELLPQWIATPERESGTVETPLRSSVWTGAVDTSGRVIPAINSVASSTMDV
ncbi:MAG: GNAT family N-acetyltransferase [Planctomycetota bacterium]